MEKNQKKFIKLILKYYKNTDSLTIFDIGARDCEESVNFSKIFPKSRIFSFECNPQVIPTAERKIKSATNIKLVKKALSNTEGTIDFFPIDCEKSRTKHIDGNPGASSLFKIENYPKNEFYVQKHIKVPTTTLSNFMSHEKIKKIDIIWMDVQGAELMVLEGLKDKIENIGLIHTEVEFVRIYKNQPLFSDIKKYLNGKGFSLLTFTSFSRYFGDAIFINNKLNSGKNFARDKYIYYYYKTVGIYIIYIGYITTFMKNLLNFKRKVNRTD